MNTRIFHFTKNISIILSSVLLIASVWTVTDKGFNKGIEFAGGMMLEVDVNDANITSNAFKAQIDKKFKINSNVYALNKNLFVIKLKASKDYSVESATQFIKEYYPNAQIVKTDFVSSYMTNVFIKNSIVASIFAILGIFIYITFRFNVKFAAASIFALLHDILITLGFISATSIELNLITVTAILTILGYCINDKIVVLDRIRTNFGLSGTNSDIIAISITSVFVRSILTSLATIIVATGLLFLGDYAIYEFAKSTIFGIVVGTYSSLFVVSWLLLLIGFNRTIKVKTTKDPMFYTT